jgi:hypothetical protein
VALKKAGGDEGENDEGEDEGEEQEGTVGKEGTAGKEGKEDGDVEVEQEEQQPTHGAVPFRQRAVPGNGAGNGSDAREVRWRNWRVLGSVAAHEWWGDLFPRGEQYILRWERNVLRNLGTAMLTLSSQTMLWAAKQTLQSTVLSAIFNPISIPGYVDNIAKQQVSGQHSEAAGEWTA